MNSAPTAAINAAAVMTVCHVTYIYIVTTLHLNKVLEQPITIKALIEYFAYYLNIPANMDKFDSLGAAYEHERNSDFETLKSKYIHDKAEEFAKDKRTLQGEFVRSLEEIMIFFRL